MTPKEAREVVNHIRFRDWQLLLGDYGNGQLYLQWQFAAIDSDTGEMTLQKGRKWVISPHAIADEIVKTAWVGVELALRHEALEAFTYRGEAIFHPHTDVEALVTLQTYRRRVTRQEK